MTEIIDATELVIEGVQKARDQGAVCAYDQTAGSDYVDVRAIARSEGLERIIFVRCYVPSRKLSAIDVQNVDAAAKQAEAHMVLVIGDGREAIGEAAIEGIGLVPYDVIHRVSADYWVDIFKPALHIYGFRFSSDQLRQDLGIPEEPAILSYMMKEMRVVGDEIDTTPEKLVEAHDRNCIPSATSVPQTFSVELPQRTFVVHPNTGARTPVTRFSFQFQLVPVAEFINKDSLGKDHYLLGTTLQDELAKKNPNADPKRIESGFDTTLRFGKYYYNPRLQFSYYCESAKKGVAKLVLLESYQGGQLFQARIEGDAALASQFVEITNPEEIDRLKSVYETFAISDRNLEGRFTAFVRTLDGAECIDDLDLTPAQAKAKKADFLFDGRKIISEFKSLQTDTSEKIARILEPYRDTPEWPMLYGEQQIHTVLSFLPNGKELNKQIFTAVTDSIEGLIESANRQIRATKESFGIPDAGGLLVIFNENIAVMSPDIVAHRVARTLRKKTESGDIRYPHVTVVMVINTGHYTQIDEQLKGLPIWVMPTGQPDPNNVESFASSLLPKWAAFDHQPLVRAKTEDFSKMSFQQFRKPSEIPKQIKRYDHWRLQYRGVRYLRRLTEGQLLAYGRKLFEDISPRFLKGAPKTPHDYMAILMERFTHFLEETGLRGVDLRRLFPEPAAERERLEALFEEYNKHKTDNGPLTRAKQRRQSRAHKNKIGRGAPCPCGSGKTYSRCHGRKTA
jgi:hypothetical protein